MEKIGAKESRKNKKKKMTASDVVLIVIFVVAITVAAVSGYAKQCSHGFNCWFCSRRCVRSAR